MVVHFDLFLVDLISEDFPLSQLVFDNILINVVFVSPLCYGLLHIESFLLLGVLLSPSGSLDQFLEVIFAVFD